MRKLLRQRLLDYQKQTRGAWYIIEQDYALSWMLYGISRVPELYRHLIFKGGTCLKKCYFGNYRFSQDLDFSVQGDFAERAGLEGLIRKACEIASEEQAKHDAVIKYDPSCYLEKEPHPGLQEAFVIGVQYPWQRESLTKIMVEVTVAEPVIVTPVERPILHPYDPYLQGAVQCYVLEEIIAEKVRALLQFSKKLHERSWGRSRARDYYDLWRIFTQYRNELNTQIILGLVRQKCALKGIDFTDSDALFSDVLLRDLEDSWEKWVKPLVYDLPDLKPVVKDLRQTLAAVLT